VSINRGFTVYVYIRQINKNDIYVEARVGRSNLLVLRLRVLIRSRSSVIRYTVTMFTVYIQYNQLNVRDNTYRRNYYFYGRTRFRLRHLSSSVVRRSALELPPPLGLSLTLSLTPFTRAPPCSLSRHNIHTHIYIYIIPNFILLMYINVKATNVCEERQRHVTTSLSLFILFGSRFSNAVQNRVDNAETFVRRYRTVFEAVLFSVPKSFVGFKPSTVNKSN